MRRHAFRSLVLAGALVALSVPVFSVTSGASPLNWFSTASACSNPGCVVTGTIGGVIDTYYSPLTLSVGSSVINEYQLMGEPTGPITITGNSLTLSVNDLRGNNQGFVVSLAAGDFSTSLAGMPSIPGTAFTYTGLGVGSGLAGCVLTCSNDVRTLGVGSNLGTSTPIAAVCPIEAVGLGTYNFVADFDLGLTQAQAEAFALVPASWYGSFTASVDESNTAVMGACGGLS